MPSMCSSCQSRLHCQFPGWGLAIVNPVLHSVVNCSGAVWKEVPATNPGEQGAHFASHGNGRSTRGTFATTICLANYMIDCQVMGAVPRGLFTLWGAERVLAERCYRCLGSAAMPSVPFERYQPCIYLEQNV